MNITETKITEKKFANRSLKSNLGTSDIYRSKYSSDYKKKKEKKKRAVHEEIKRTSEMETYL